MKRRLSIVLALAAVVASAAGWAFFQRQGPGVGMTEAAQAYLESLSAEQRAQSLLTYDGPQRVDWHFIPKDERKGVQIKHMDEKQRKAAHALLSSALSEVGYDKATTIMQLERILDMLEPKEGRRNIRDPERYYFTVFGKPAADSKWGLSVEGHHLSLNFVVEKGEVVSSTPAFFGANPATVMADVEGGLPKGTRVLKDEEQLAFDLLASLDEKQRQTAVIDAKAPAEIRATGETQPPAEEAVGIAVGELTREQKQTLAKLVEAYANNMPAEVAKARMSAIREAGVDKVHFAWAGADKPGIGHYYRVQGPTFSIEFVNTQPDPAGNVANHIHCVWRDLAGDFAIPVASK
jgi:hypothetical protein